MSESSISFTKNFAVFRNEKELVAGIGRILTKGIGLQRPAAILRLMAREVSSMSNEGVSERVSIRTFGDYYLTLARYGSGLVPLLASEIESSQRSQGDAERLEGPDVKARRLMRQINQSEHAEKLTTSGNVTVQVNSPQEAATVLDTVLAVVPIRKEIALPDAYTNPQPVRYTALTVEGTYEEREMPAYPMFEIRRSGNTQDYAQAIMAEHRMGPYITDGDLSVYVGGYPAENERDRYNISITLMKTPNPLLSRPLPFSGQDQQTAETLLGGLQQQLQTR